MYNEITEVKPRVLAAFRQHYGSAPRWLVRAPGRVNLIGEHTDYNDGFVLPMAIERNVWIALRPRNDPTVHVQSLDFDQHAHFRLTDLHRTNDAALAWLEYLKGTAWALQQQGHPLQGWEGVLAGDVPLGAGLSSSAALELAALRAFAVVAALAWSPAEMARLGQQAENQWVGVQCGIMDQMISAAGQAGHALLIDCRSLSTRSVPLPTGSVVVILDTATRRGLVDSAYNERRRQCEAAAGHFGVAALRDVTEAALAQSGLTGVTLKRARHVVTENARTLSAASAMERGDAEALGRLMQASHASLRDDFEVSSAELDLMVSLAQEEGSCYGARMTGAGFGGCAVALVSQGEVEGFVARVGAAYERRSGRRAVLYVSEAAAGASVDEIQQAGSVSVF